MLLETAGSSCLVSRVRGGFGGKAGNGEGGKNQLAVQVSAQSNVLCEEK